MRPDTLLIDFGGVLTTSVLDSFAEFCRGEGLEQDAVLRCVSKDAVGRRLLVEIEEGRISGDDFQARFAARLSELGDRTVEPDGLLSRLNAGLRPEPALVAATEALRRAGVRTVLVSNSLGEEAYEWCDLELLFDHVVLSGHVGVRKPSRRIFRHALELSGAAPERALMVDDLEQNLLGASRVGIQTYLHSDAHATVRELQRAFDVEL
jgi:putative hydrolase of the HAD superfamily